MAPSRIRTAGPWFGAVAVLVTTVSLLAAVALSPSFTWTGNALSNLGVPENPAGTTTTALIFNGGLVVGGLAGTAFGLWLVAESRHVLERIGATVFTASMLAMGGIGVFPQDQPLHFEMATGFYFLFSVATLLIALGQWRTHTLRLAFVSAGAGLGNLLTWVVWAQTGNVDRPGLAIPETIGATLVVGWTVTVAYWYVRD